MLTHIRLRFIIPTIIAASITGAAAMSSSAATSITVAPSTSTQPKQELEKRTQQATNNETPTLKNKPLASWTAADLVTWFNQEAPTQNAKIPMLPWANQWLMKNDIHRIFKQHTDWYTNADALMNLLVKTHYFTYLMMNNYITYYKEDPTTVAINLLTALQEFVGTPTKQPAPSDKPDIKEAKATAPTYTSDEPSIEDDHEIQAIIIQQPKVIGRSGPNATLRLQPQAQQEPLACTTCPAQKASAPPKKGRNFQSITYRRL